MLSGIKFKANPTLEQKKILSQWMGVSRLIWNAKCDEERYYATFARKFYPLGTYAPIDQTTAQFKDKYLTPWLYNVPSQIMRNSAVNWYQTFKKFMQGKCGKPKRKLKTDKGSIHLTREVFKFEKYEDGVLRLFIGTKKNNIGYLSFKAHREFKIPNSIYIKKLCGKYTLSFCYENNKNNADLVGKDEYLQYLQNSSIDYLNENVIGIDRGVAIPVHIGNTTFDFTAAQKKNKIKAERKIKYLSAKFARQKSKTSKRRCKTRKRIAKNHIKCANIRKDFCHKTSHSLVHSQSKIFIFEDLKISNMTKKPKVKQDINGKFLSNRAAQKAGLNKAILDKGWYQLEVFTEYKAYNAGKVVFKVPAQYTSQECADCSHIHPDNRVSQKLFKCGHCGHIDNADRNASLVIKKRAIKLILDTGTVLSAKKVLVSVDTGRGAKNKPGKGSPLLASGIEPSKKKRTSAKKLAA